MRRDPSHGSQQHARRDSTPTRDARCERCHGRWIDPDSEREAAKCRDCGGDGWSDVVDLAAPIVKDQLIAPLDDDAPFELTADGVMDVIYRWDIDDGLDVADHVETVLRLPRFSGRVDVPPVLWSRDT
jgi:hypothetical protein